MDLQSLRTLSDPKALGVLALSLIGAGWISSYLISFARMLLDLVRPGIPLKRFGAHKGAWAGTSIPLNPLIPASEIREILIP